MERNVGKSEGMYMQKPDEISVRNLVLSIRKHIRLLIRRWYLILLASMLGGGYFYKKVENIQQTFPAKVRLLIRPQNIAKENKLMVQIYSRLINSPTFLQSLLLEKVGPEKELLINKYLNTYYLHKPGELSADIPEGFQFKNDKLSTLVLEEKKVFKIIMDKISTPMSDFTDGFVSISTDEALGFITINISSPTEELSLTLLDRLCQMTEKMLSDNTVFAPKIAFDKLEIETDSLAKAYKEDYYQLNKYRDNYSRKLKEEEPNIKEVKYLEKKIHRYEVEAEMSKTRYLAALEQLKSSQVKMDQKTLLIQQLERTYPPIAPYEPSAKKAGIKGTIIGGAILVFILVLGSIWKTIQEEIDKNDPEIDHNKALELKGLPVQ